MSTRNLAPSPDYPERATNTVDKIVATPRRNALGERSGERDFEEGPGFQHEYGQAFFQAVDATDRADHVTVEVKIAGQANGRGRLGSGQEIPAWDAVPQESLDGFSAGSSGDPGRANPFPFQPRAGSNPNTLSPLVGLNRGERPNTAMVTTTAVNTARSRTNQADVTSL
jgi:hypothetical protein